MTKTFDMQFIRYINLFNKVTRVSANHCFLYNNTLVFAVPKQLIERSIGKDNSNLRKMSNILGKRVRVVPEPSSKEDLDFFISVLISPIKYQNLEVKEGEAIITADRETKAMLIGRGRAREAELKEILSEYFGIKAIKII